MAGVEPAPIVPTPASEFTSLRGRRVIIGLPGLSFRNHLPTGDPVVQDSHTHVPILTEHDYYRAEIEGLEAFAILVPIDRVWVEFAPDRDALPNLTAALLDRPPMTRATAAAEATSLVGRRVVQQ